jgi:hypothetical protein
MVNEKTTNKIRPYVACYQRHNSEAEVRGPLEKYIS